MHLVDRMSAQDGRTLQARRPQGSVRTYLMSRYITLDEAKKGLEDGSLFKGVIRINKRNRFDAYVTLEDRDPMDRKLTETSSSDDTTGEMDVFEKDDVYICGNRPRNRALEGDVVVIRILKAEELEREIRFVKDRKTKRKLEEAERMKKVGLAEDAENGVRVEEDDAVDEEDYERPHDFAKVVYIWERKEGLTFSGTLSLHMFPQERKKDASKATDTAEVKENQSNNTSSIRLLWFRPSDKRVPIMAIPIPHAPRDFLSQPGFYEDKLFSASVLHWPASSNHPFGVVHGVIGPMGYIPTETQALLWESGVTWDDTFSKDVLDCLPKSLPWTIPETEISKRRDMRFHRIFSIDPPTARDLDDAVSVTPLDEEGHIYEVGVHIADVSHFVLPDTALDKEATKRCTTVYLVQKAVPMLPRLLCEDLCSLNAGTDRLAFSVTWKFDRRTREVVPGTTPWFGKTVIRSCAKLSYEHAQRVIEGRGWDDGEEGSSFKPPEIHNGYTFEQVRDDILLLYDISKRLREGRFENGALAIHTDKLWFSINSEGIPHSCGVYEIRDSNRLIEEFMLLANISVAHKISSQFPENSLLRRHGPPISRAMTDFLQTAKNLLGFTIDASSAAALHESFQAVAAGTLVPDASNPNAYLAKANPVDAKTVLNHLVIKPMQRAKYFCSGAVDIKLYGHYALSVPLYTHFTSPIRRYCDIIVHRQLELALLKDAGKLTDTDSIEDMYGVKKVSRIAANCNDRKDGARSAQDASQNLYLCTYLDALVKAQISGAALRARVAMGSTSVDGETHPIVQNATRGLLVEALVYNIMPRSFDILIQRYGIEKRVWIEDLVDRGEIYGSRWDEKNLGVVLFWKRRQDWDFDVEESGMEGVKTEEEVLSKVGSNAIELEVELAKEKVEERLNLIEEREIEELVEEAADELGESDQQIIGMTSGADGDDELAQSAREPDSASSVPSTPLGTSYPERHDGSLKESEHNGGDEGGRSFDVKDSEDDVVLETSSGDADDDDRLIFDSADEENEEFDGEADNSKEHIELFDEFWTGEEADIETGGEGAGGAAPDWMQYHKKRPHRLAVRRSRVLYESGPASASSLNSAKDGDPKIGDIIEHTVVKQTVIEMRDAVTDTASLEDGDDEFEGFAGEEDNTEDDRAAGKAVAVQASSSAAVLAKALGKSKSPKDRNTTVVKMDASEVRVQIVRIFGRIPVRIVPEITRSPVDFKVFAEYPGFVKELNQESGSEKESTSRTLANREPEYESIMFAGIVDEAD
ncbi:hypothetical protein BJ742DRAFT_295003 [Cladochytrium replicatum]|nr:hypothetical protein BJ742DRAFT_295003 [Cladochytrium replicatum]